MKRFHQPVLACLWLTICGCGGSAPPPGGDGPADPAVGGGQAPAAESGVLSVDLGDNFQATAQHHVQVTAAVQGASDEEEIYYLWKVLPERGVEAAHSEDFVLGLDRIGFAIEELFPAARAGERYRVRADVLALSRDDARQASDEVIIRVIDPPASPEEPGGSDDPGAGPQPGTDPPAPPDEDDGVDDGTGAPGDVNGNPDPGSGGGSGSPGAGGPGGPAEEPCTGVTHLKIVQPPHVTILLSQGILNLAPVVCAGTPPYAFWWSPITHLVDPGGALGTTPTSITSDNADFVPPAAGNYEITVQVTDAEGTVAAVTYSISVVNHAPLVADAGPDHAVAVSAGGSVTLGGQPSAKGGSGSYAYAWTPSGGSGSTLVVSTAALGEKTYTLKVTDNLTGVTASDTVRVVVLPTDESACSAGVAALEDDPASFVAIDPLFGSEGQAVVVIGSKVLLHDIEQDEVRAELELPAPAKGLAVDPQRGRAFVSTRIDGQFTRSVQIIDLQAGQLGTNVPLTASVALARGLAVVPSTGEVLVAVSGEHSGLLKIDPGAAGVSGALQNIHHPGSFSQPIDVAVIEEGGLAVAAVANASGDYLTLMGLDDIAFTPDTAPGGGGLAALPKAELAGTARAVAADPEHGRFAAAWNNGNMEGRMQIVTVTAPDSFETGVEIAMDGPVQDQGLACHSAAGVAYAALGASGTAVVNLDFEIIVNRIESGSGAARAVAADGAAHRVVIAGRDPVLSWRCPGGD